ncbi:hypothetical protein FVEN_g12662 [Fusarium venenatum]|nr:hypothetical protein FVEN_g12662 [Fusarium venenatum]
MAQLGYTDFMNVEKISQRWLTNKTMKAIRTHKSKKRQQMVFKRTA